MDMQPQAILLDFYGTVVREDDAAIRQICRQVAAASPLSTTTAQVGSWWARAFRALCAASHGPSFRRQRELERLSLQQVLAQAEADLDAEALSQPMYAYWTRPEPLPESRRVLARCPVPICLVSNIDTADLQQALAHVGLSFAAIVTSEDCRAYKPHPAPFERALSLLGLPPSHALHVGDSWGSDVVGAQAAGIPVLWINRRQRPIPDGGSPPTFMAADLTGLLEIVGPS
jgi:2-haloacid dehalogenase/putative hydrolase of the HAD superfamily